MTSMPWVDAEVARVGRLFADGRLAHALLVGGPSGLGKRVFAEQLAQRILCRDPRDGLACGECRDCRAFQNRYQLDELETAPDGSLAHPDGHPGHPDARFIGFAWKLKPKPKAMRKELVIDQIRELSEWFYKSSHNGGAKIALIRPAELLNANAANALLKTLEEPQPGRFLMLIADRPERLAITLRSRCQRFSPRPPSRDDALAWLASQGHAGETAQSALDLADGLPLRAISYIEDDVIALQAAVRRDLGNAATGKQAPFSLAKEWMADRPTLRLELAVALVRNLGRKKLAAGKTPSDLTARVDFPKLAAWADRANRARSLFDTSIRHELLIGELLLDWRVAFSESSGQAA